MAFGGKILLQFAPCLFWLTLAFLALDMLFSAIGFLLSILIGLALCFYFPRIIPFMHFIFPRKVHQWLTSASFPNTDLKRLMVWSNLMIEHAELSLCTEVYQISLLNLFS